MSLIARLGVVLGLNSSEFISGLDAATKKTREFEMNQRRALKNAEKAQDEFMMMAGNGLMKVAAAAIAVGAAFKYADDIQDTAEAYDVTTQSLLAMKAAMQGAGGEADNIGNVLQKLATSQQSAKDGSDEMREAFTKLGISGRDVEKLSLEDFFKRVAQELAKVENTTERTALAQQVLGKAIKGTDIRAFVDKYKEFNDPALLTAINENAKAWGNIEKWFKELLNNVQKAILPFAILLNTIRDIQETFADVKAGADIEIDWGAMEGRPGEAVTYHQGKGKKPPEKPMALPSQEGNYSTKTDKQKAEDKKNSDAAKKAAEAKAQLKIEIGLIEQKIKYQEEIFNLDMQGIYLGSKAIEQEKSRVQYAMDIASIISDAQKERTKEGAQLDLINKKEQAKIKERYAQYQQESALREEKQKHLHNLAMQAISEETEKHQRAKQEETLNELDLLKIEKERFDLGSNAYELAKFDVETENKRRDIRLQYLEASKLINKEFDLSAKTARDLEIYEEKINSLKIQQGISQEYLTASANAKKNVMKQQAEFQDRMFKLDLAEQKGKELYAIESQYKTQSKLLDLEDKRFSMSTNSYNLEKLRLENYFSLIEVEKKYAQQQQDAFIEMQRQGGGQKAREQYEDRIKNIQEIRDAELDSISKINQARQRNLDNEIARQKSFTDGWAEASKRYQENAENAFARGGQAFASVMSNMDAAMNRFAETGKFKFEEFALSVIKDLIRIQLQAQATALFSMISGSISGAFNRAPAANPGTPAAGVAFNQGLIKAASGGFINAPTIVGENGAELFVPNTPGTIIPNGSWQQAAASMGNNGFTNNGTYIANMSAIDTQSATQFLASNKQSVWAAYQSANRAVPISR